MTTSAPSFKISNVDTTSFRAWGSAVNAALAAVGLVQTADTGQINWTTVTVPSASTDGGYEIWGLNDSLQSTVPFYLKLAYGSGNASYPRLMAGVGTGTSGAGALTGLYNSSLISSSNAYMSGHGDANTTSYFSSDASHLTMQLLGSISGTIYPLTTLVVDRTRNSDGTANGDGLYVYEQGNASTTSNYAYYISMGTKTVMSSYMPPVVVPIGLSSAASGGNVAVFPHQISLPKRESPALGCLTYFENDISRGSTFSATHLGASHTYLALGSWAPGTDVNRTASARLAIRYE